MIIISGKSVIRVIKRPNIVKPRTRLPAKEKFTHRFLRFLSTKNQKPAYKKNSFVPKDDKQKK